MADLKCVHCGLDDCANIGSFGDRGDANDPELSRTTLSDSKKCVSCDRPMDFDVYFTVCPHCGFNYRIQVSPMEHEEGIGLGTFLKMLLVAAGAVVLGYSVLWLIVL